MTEESWESCQRLAEDIGLLRDAPDYCAKERKVSLAGKERQLPPSPKHEMRRLRLLAPYLVEADGRPSADASCPPGYVPSVWKGELLESLKKYARREVRNHSFANHATLTQAANDLSLHVLKLCHDYLLGLDPLDRCYSNPMALCRTMLRREVKRLIRGTEIVGNSETPVEDERQMESALLADPYCAAPKGPPGPEGLAILAERLRLAEECLGSLTNERMKTVFLHYMEHIDDDMTTREQAKRLGMAFGTFASYRKRAKDKLIDCIRQREELQAN